MTHIHNLKHLSVARKLLRRSLTAEEKKLWFQLRNNSLGYRFRRQHGIGNFIVDFFCAEKRLIIELDGGQHLDNKEADQERTNYFESLGIKVIRFWNNEVNNNIEVVMAKIKEELDQPHPSP